MQTHRNPTPATVVYLQNYTGSNRMSQGAPEGSREVETVREGGDRVGDVANAAVNAWIQRIMLGLVSILLTIGTAYFVWSIPAITSISTDVRLSAANQSYIRQEVDKVSRSNDEMKITLATLTAQSLTWASKDQMNSTRDELRQRIDSVQAELNQLNLKLTRLEGQPRR